LPSKIIMLEVHRGQVGLQGWIGNVIGRSRWALLGSGPATRRFVSMNRPWVSFSVGGYVSVSIGAMSDLGRIGRISPLNL
jgi:hypothetical protein